MYWLQEMSDFLYDSDEDENDGHTLKWVLVIVDDIFSNSESIIRQNSRYFIKVLSLLLLLVDIMRFVICFFWAPRRFCADFCYKFIWGIFFIIISVIFFGAIIHRPQLRLRKFRNFLVFKKKNSCVHISYPIRIQGKINNEETWL